MTTLQQILSQESSALKWLGCWLRVVVVIQCFGLGGRYLFSAQEIESDIYGWLYFDQQWNESFAQSIDNAGALLTFAAGCLLCVTGWFGRRPGSDKFRVRSMHWVDQAAALWVAAWTFMIALAQMMRVAEYPHLALAEHAVRYLAPVALFIISGMVFKADQAMDLRTGATGFAVPLLIMAVALTFAAHGYKAIDSYGPFTDLILLSDHQWTKFGLSQATAERLLFGIGVIDMLAATLLIIVRSRLAAFYMALWGFVTAASRVTALGLSAWPEILIRFANGGVPMALLLYFAIAGNRSPNQIETAGDLGPD